MVGHKEKYTLALKEFIRVILRRHEHKLLTIKRDNTSTPFFGVLNPKTLTNKELCVQIPKSIHIRSVFFSKSCCFYCLRKSTL